MRRLCTLLFLFTAAAHAQVLTFGPERAVVPQSFVDYRGPVTVAGVATNGTRVLVVWAPAVRVDDPFRDNPVWYVTFIGGETKPLPPRGPRGTTMPTAVIWSGAAFFVFMDDGHAIRVSPEGTLSPSPFSYGRWKQLASNGDGFIEVWWESSVGGSLHARFYDRNGVPLRELQPVPALGEFVSAAREDGDYVITYDVLNDARNGFLLRRVIVHRDGTRDVQPFDRKYSAASHLSAAGDALMIDKTLLLAGREIELDGHGLLAWDGTSYLVLTPKSLHRFTRTGSLIDAKPGDYAHAIAVIPRRFRKPLVIRTTETMLLVNDEAPQLRHLVDQTYPAASSDGTSTVVAWRERNVLKVKVLGRPITASVNLETSTRAIRAISIAGLHFLVWFEERSVRMLRVSADGTLLDRAPVVLAKTDDPLYGWGLAPVLATNGRELFVAWPEHKKVRARYVTRDGVAGEPFDLDIGSHYSRATFDGEHYVVFWFELGSDRNPLASPPERLLSVVVNGREAAPPVVVAKDVSSSSSLVLTPSQAFWWDYQVPSSHNVDVSADGTPLLPPSQEYLRSVRLGRGGTPELNPFNVAHMERQGGFWVPQDLAVASDHLLWTEEHDLDVMPVAGGEVVRVGPADWGSLNVVQTNAGPLLVYANDGNVVIREATSPSTGTH